MSSKQGNIGVTSENIFPIIKKFLYSDHEIFLRELVSNAVDATQKLKTLSSVGEFKGELGDLTVQVKFDDKTITISDRGIGMTAEEIDKYINQIAFSGAEEFVEKYKNDAASIIGHFGLGFYSSFMVSKKVEIVTKSYKEGAVPMKWSCDGTPEYSLEETTKEDRGTDIILYIDDENKDFLNKDKINGLLTKYCRFLPVPIAFGKKQEWKDGKYVDTDEDNVINDTKPAWVRKPADMTDEDYKKFYRDLYPMTDEPLFWIHLNVDYPFNLKGILYFPKINHEFAGQEGQIKLYNNQVFVADNVKEVIPEFLMLLKGVIDCPDLPLNVSRSFLQNDGYVKKISSHITKKVADKLTSIYNNERENYEKYWDYINIFIKYGCLRDEKFYEKVKDVIIYKDIDGKYLTLDEYLDGKEEKDVYYVSDPQTQSQYINMFKAEGMDALIMTQTIDSPFITLLEQKNENVHFYRIDAELSDNFVGEELSEETAKEYKDKLTATFEKALDMKNLNVKVESLKDENTSSILTQPEETRRMQEMMKMYGMTGMDPSMFGGQETLILNAKHPLVQYILKNGENDNTSLFCEQLYDLAMISHKPLSPDEMTKFVSRSNQIMMLLAK